MRKKGFTLIELLAVIIVLAVIALITTPIVLNVVDSAKERANEQSIRGYAEALEYKRTEELFKGNTVNDDDLTSLSLDTKGNEVNCSVIKFNNSGITLDGCTLENSSDTYCLINNEVLKNDSCNVQNNITYKDNSGANAPELLINMIPIKYDGTNWIYASTTEKWYDYEEKEWANAVVLNSDVSKNVGDTISEDDIALWYVWIPRYKYIIFNGNNESVPEQVINVTFESGTSTTGTVKCHDAINQTDSDGNLISEICIDDTQEDNKIVNNTSTYTHPAFCFGTKNTDGTCNGDELTGFWFSKFEISGTIDAITVIPNTNPLTNKTVSEFYNAIKAITTVYGINGDSHMMKNMEWGSVAYLSQSKYGLGLTDIGINNYYNGAENDEEVLMITGCGTDAGYGKNTTCNSYDTKNGMKASTTGNIYGVYDMSGASWEYTMGNTFNSSGEFYSSGSGFSSIIDNKYYDAYSYDTNNITHARGKLGDATKETVTDFGNYKGGWNEDYAHFPNSSFSWFRRGGDFTYSRLSGVFSFFSYNGKINNYFSTRSVLSKI